MTTLIALATAFLILTPWAGKVAILAGAIDKLLGLLGGIPGMGAIRLSGFGLGYTVIFISIGLFIIGTLAQLLIRPRPQWLKRNAP